MDKQIEEMAEDLQYCIVYLSDDSWQPVFDEFAEKLYNAGYRKILEGAVVLTREEAETIYRTLKANEEFIFDLQEATMGCKKEIEEAQEVAVKEIEEYVQQARKETAEKIFDKLYTWLDLEEIEKDGFVTIQKFDFLRKYREIFKEISEGTEDVKNE